MYDDWTSHESLPLETAPTDPPAWRSTRRGGLAALPRQHRPREKAFAKGVAALAASELLALVLGNGTSKTEVLALAERLIRRHGLKGLRALTPNDWTREPGVGAALAARLASAYELGRRARGATEGDERPRVTRPREVFALTRELRHAKKEHLIGLYLDAQNGLVHRETISIGSLNTTRTHPREILYPAIAHLALGFILVHNHPSGSLDPSDEDVAFTRAIHRAGETVGIELYDHLIVARGGLTSLRERGAF
jgi:DNA repair protein RadC